MKSRAKKLIAAFAIIAGGLLISFELAQFATSDEPIVGWFWIFIAILAIGLGIAELRSSPSDDGEKDPPMPPLG